MSRSHKLEEHIQLTHNDLRIGMAGIHLDEYVAADGRQTQGVVAGLWLYMRDDPQLDRQEWVWPGSRLTIGKYAIEVVSVGEGAVEIVLTP